MSDEHQAVPVAQEYPASAIGALTGLQRQIDSDGTFVGVSRQALDELIAWAEAHRLALPCKSGEGAAFEIAAQIAEGKGGYFAIPAKPGRSFFEHVGSAIAAAIRDHASTLPISAPSQQFAKSSPDAEIPEGMKPWKGGDSAPKDWDGGPVLWIERAGHIRIGHKQPEQPWAHCVKNWFDIIAYTPSSPYAAGSGGEALRMARDLIAVIEQTSNNVWWVNADDPETAVCDTLSAIERAIAVTPDATQTREAESPERYRHVKRGTVYEVVGRAELQVNNIALTDGVAMVVYRGEDGKLWARGEAEFRDGRFELVAPSDDTSGAGVA